MSRFKFLPVVTAVMVLLAGVVIAQAVSMPNASAAGQWSRLAECESHNKNVISPNGKYHGYFQISLPTWKSVGGRTWKSVSGRFVGPTRYGYSYQLAKAKKIQARDGWTAWPSCCAQLDYC